MATDGSDRHANGGGPDDEVSFVHVANVLLKHRRWIVLVPLVLGLWVAANVLTQPRSYVATASFMPQMSESRSGSAAAGLARQLGVNVGMGDRPGQSPQFYANLVQTREVLRKVVEYDYDLVDEAGQRYRGTLIDAFQMVESEGPPAWWRAVNRLRSGLHVSVDRNTGVVQLTLSAASPRLAEQVLERALEVVHDFNLEARQHSATDEGRFIQDRMTEAHAELLQAEAELQQFLRNNREFGNSPELVFEHERLQRQVSMRQEIYTALAQSREQARIDAVRDTPLLTVIDHPAASGLPEGRGGLRRVLVALILGGLFTSLLALLIEFGRRTRDQSRNEYQELNRLTREAWDDLRRPWRMVPRRAGPRPKVAAE